MQTFCRVLYQQGVGTIIDTQAATFRQHRASTTVAVNQRSKIGCLSVVNLQKFGIHRLEFANRELRFEVRCFTSCNFLGRRNHDDVAVLAHIQTFSRHYDVECLIPWNVAQAQGHITLDRVGNYDVLSGRLGQQLQYSACLDVLEVQRQALTFVFFGF